MTKLISSCDKVTCLVVEAKAVDVVYLDFTKAYDNISHSILVEKPTAYILDECKKWLDSPECGGEWNQIQLVAGQ